MMAKVTITMNDDLLAQLDEYADNNYLTRSGAISNFVNSGLQSRQMVGDIHKVSDAMQALAAGRDLSPDDQMALDAFVALSKMLPK